jgi:DNA-binding transcriptional LysR family regulator
MITLGYRMRLLVSRHLENFLALYATRNMHAAADRKGISQPALTKSLRLLEEDLGATLFVRSHKGLEPTEAANVLYRYARAIDQEARFATLDVQNLRSPLSGQMRIGIGPVLAGSVFPAVFVEFHRSFPSVEFAVEIGVSSGLVERLVRDDLDLVVTALPEEPLPERYVGLPVFRSEMTVICREGHPLRALRNVTLAELAQYKRVGFTEDREFEKKSGPVFGQRAEAMKPLLQTTSLSVMFGILVATDYYAVVSEMILPSARREGLDRVRSHQDLWTIEIGLMSKSSLSTSKPVSAIRNALLKYDRLHSDRK